MARKMGFSFFAVAILQVFTLFKLLYLQTCRVINQNYFSLRELIRDYSTPLSQLRGSMILNSKTLLLNLF
jgi:hypothetical protein